MTLNIDERTFGLELEFGNLYKPNVLLPKGYKFSPDERSIVNSNATKSTPSGDYGAEINTRPLHTNMNDVRELRAFIKSCLYDWNGRLMWNTGFDWHLFIGDFGLDELKAVFALGYHTTALIKEVFNLGPWFDVDILVPTPSREIYEKVMRTDTIEAFRNAFANSSNRGHWRFPINVMAYFRTQTLEFRIFNSTENFRETLETIRFMYRFVDYALTHTEEDYKKIKTTDDFKNVFGISHSLPKQVAPLIFAEDVNVFTSNIAKGFAPASNIVSAIASATEDNIVLVNPFEYSSELLLSDSKKITIVNSEEYANAIYEIANGVSVTYEDEYSVLNQYKDGTPEMELTLFFIFARVQKYNMSTEYGEKEFLAYVERIPDSIAKIKERSENIVKLFKKAEYMVGDIYDAFKQGSTVIYQQVGYGKHNSVMSSIKKHSNWSVNWLPIKCDFSYVIEESEKQNKTLFVVSKNAFLPLNKVSKDGSVYLYSNRDVNLGCRIGIKEEESFSFEIPDNDYRITEDTKLRILEARPSFFSYLQKRFIKKVQKTSQVKFGYIICDEDKVLGAFGFEYPKNQEYSLWLLSDFCTNNDVPKLSKLVLYVIMTKEVKRAIEKKISERVKNCYTKVYTNMPVSMKYRGAFNKAGRDDKSLIYDFEFGSVPSLKEAVSIYLKKLK